MADSTVGAPRNSGDKPGGDGASSAGVASAARSYLAEPHAGAAAAAAAAAQQAAAAAAGTSWSTITYAAMKGNERRAAVTAGSVASPTPTAQSSLRPLSGAGGDATNAAAAGSGGNDANLRGPSLATGLMASRAATKLKDKQQRVRKGEFRLRINPSDNVHPPVGIPVREVLQQIYTYKRDRTIKDFFIYVLYMVIFTAVVYQINNTADAYSTNAGLYNTFLDQDFPSATWKKTYFDIGNFEELHEWMEGPLLQGLYPEVQGYNDQPLPADKQQFIDKYLRRASGARIWQVRVANTSCSLYNSLLDPFNRASGSSFTACYGPMLPGRNVATQPYGPPWDPQA
jgi:hypothetical protein